MQTRNIVRCVLSGSFHRDPAGIERAYLELATNGCQILSPHRMQFIEKGAEFVRDAAEKDLEVGVIEAHHLIGISQADFLWIHIFEGYVGLSAALEIGYATARNIPVFASSEPAEEILGQFITVVPSVFEAVRKLKP